MFSGVGTTEGLGTGAQGPNSGSRFPKKHMNSWPVLLECDFVTKQTQIYSGTLPFCLNTDIISALNAAIVFVNIYAAASQTVLFVLYFDMKPWECDSSSTLTVIAARPAFPLLYCL